MHVISNIKRGKYKTYTEEDKKAELKRLNNLRAGRFRERQKEKKLLNSEEKPRKQRKKKILSSEEIEKKKEQKKEYNRQYRQKQKEKLRSN